MSLISQNNLIKVTDAGFSDSGIYRIIAIEGLGRSVALYPVSFDQELEDDKKSKEKLKANKKIIIVEVGLIYQLEEESKLHKVNHYK